MSVVRFAPATPSRRELGAPGTKHWAGRIATEEYVPELQGSRAFDVYERMRRADAMCKAVLRALKLPILQASSEIDPASDDRADHEIAAFVRWNLFEGLSHSWRSHMRQGLTCLDFGFSVFEHVWAEPRSSLFIPAKPLSIDDLYAIRGQLRKVEALIDSSTFDGEREAAEAAKARLLERYGRAGTRFDRPVVVLKKIAPRLQRTIAEWELAEDGGLIKIKQKLFGTGAGRDTAEIPVGKLVLYVNEQEGANWTGQSVLRPAYKHWFVKDQLYRIQAINAERFGVGIPIVTVGPDDSADTEKMDRAEEIGEGVRAGEKVNVTLPHDWKFTLDGIAGKALDLEPIIRHHDRGIALSVLAHFLSLGATSEGSNALSGDQSSFFFLSLRGLADEMSDVVNRYVIPKLVDANWSGVTRYPKLAIRKIETRDLESFFNALGTAAGQKLITPDEVLETELREIAGLPPRDPTTARARAGAAPAPRPQPKGELPGTKPAPVPAPAPAADDDEEEGGEE